jgi:hypothetical protein
MPSWIPKKIISGGQTGVDRAALDWAISRAGDHGGWCPHGRLAQDGLLPSRYILRETQSPGYSQRTRLNIEEADATLLVHCGPLMGGSDLTQRLAIKLIKPLALFDTSQPWPDQITSTQTWISSNSIHVLNIAGPSEQRHHGIYETTLKVLDQLFSK